MCGRFTLTTDLIAAITSALGFEPDQAFLERYAPHWNIAPTQEHWVVMEQHEERTAQHASWGLVNWWEADRRVGAQHINARAESLEGRRAYAEAFRQHRCLVPADGFFEWTGDRKSRRPFWFHRPDRQPFAFAGLAARARLRDEAGALTTFTIVTTEANGLVGRIHDRMPVILPDEESMAAWLHGDAPIEQLKALLRPVDDRYLVARAVSTRVNSVAHDDPACIEEAEGDTQAALF